MSDHGGEPEQLAPVIPLFGRTPRATPADSGSANAVSTPARPATEPADGAAESAGAGSAGVDSQRNAADGIGAWRSTWSGGSATAGATAGAGAATGPRDPSERHPARGAAARSTPRLRALHTGEDSAGVEDSAGGREAPDADALREAAEQVLVRKLRSRSLSISESRMVLKGYEQDRIRLETGVIDDIIDDFCRRGYLDDAVLADQLVTSGVGRKGQGRVALSRALSQRGLPRDIIDAALDELPDDDAERALEFARSKAQSLSRLDADTALRRLVGQLSRRGYNGSVAMNAAKTALAESSFRGPRSGVRFVDSD